MLLYELRFERKMDKNVSTLSDIYQYYLSIGDPRVENWMMMKSPMKTIGFMFTYLLALRLIKENMANKKPFELRAFLIVYNFFQVCGSFYIFVEVFLDFTQFFDAFNSFERFFQKYSY